MDTLKQDRKTVVIESLEYLESVASMRNVTMLANVNKHIGSFAYYDNLKRDGTGTEEWKTQFNILSTASSKTEFGISGGHRSEFF